MSLILYVCCQLARNFRPAFTIFDLGVDEDKFDASDTADSSSIDNPELPL